MSLNTRIGLILFAVLLLSPVWLPLLPLIVWWFVRQRRLARAAGFRQLLLCQAQALAAYAEATMGKEPPDGWMQVARNVDAYLAAIRSPRHWRTNMVLTLLELGPLLRGHRPLSRMALAVRQRWIAERLSTTRGLFAVPSLARQLVRMGYYADASIAESLGFRSMRSRNRRASLAPTRRIAGVITERVA